MTPNTHASTTSAMRPSILTACAAVACVVFAVRGPCLGDSLTYVGQAGGAYWYLASASDTLWEAGNVVALTGMEQVTGANEPAGFSASFTPLSVTWTCQTDTSGFFLFSVSSGAPTGTISYGIQSTDPSVGFIEGPQYTPEPTTVIMFLGGLVTLGAVVWRRSGAARRAA